MEEVKEQVGTYERKDYTVEEYFALEEAAEYRSEYYAGEIEMMSGASLSHNRIVSELLATLNKLLKGKSCEEFGSDLKVNIEKQNKFLYPDAMVVCGEPQLVPDRNDAITNPTLIAEILSPSTEHRDRGEKFQAYQQLSSLREYVLISQEQIMVETFFKQDEKTWLYRRFTEEERTLSLQSLGLSLSLADLYHRVVFTDQK